MGIARLSVDRTGARGVLSTASVIFAFLAACLVPAERAAAHPSARDEMQPVLKGKALDVGISSGGVSYIIGSDGKAWRWGSSFGEEWSFAGGRGFRRVDVGPDGKPWAVDRTGGIFFYNSAYWEKRGDGAVDIGVGPKGVVLALLKDGRIVGWNPAKKRFDRYLSRKGRRIDVDESGRPWIVDDQGRLAHHTGKAWRVFETKARDVSVAPGGGVFLVRGNGVTSHRVTSSVFQDIPGFTRTVSLSAGPEGNLWAVREDQSILFMSLFEKERGVEGRVASRGPKRPTMEQILNNQRRRRSSVDAAIVTDPSPFEFVLVTGIEAFDIGIGADGSVFASDVNGFFKLFSERERMFLDFPGQIQAVAVDSKGNPWGVTPNGDVFRHNGTDWQQRTGQFETAVDIAINHRNAVFLTDVEEKVFRFDEETGKFLRFPALKGTRIAVDPKGRPWTVTRAGVVFRCDADIGCTRAAAPQTQDIGIGPDGSIFIASADNALLRYNAREEKFEFLPKVGTGVRVVEVGPRGRPWVIDLNGRVFASGFFKRDETDDARTVETTRTETSDLPTIVFTKRLDLPSFTNVRRRIPNAGTVRAARNGEVLVTADDGAIWRFDRVKKRFRRQAITAPLIDQSVGGLFIPVTAISPDGRLVYLEDDVGATTTTHRIFRQHKIGRTGVKLLTEITLDNDNVDARIHVGPEGNLYFTIIEATPGRSRLFAMPPSRNVLTEIDLAAAGVDPVANFLDLTGGGREGELDNTFENIASGRMSIEVLKFNRGRGRSATQVLRAAKFERVFDTTRDITAFAGNLKNFYACIDEILSRFNRKTKRFDRTNIRCTNIAVTPEELVFYIEPL